MKFLTVTGALFIALIGAIFAFPLINTVVNIETNSALAESVSLPSSAEEFSAADLDQANLTTEAQSIPVTDIQAAVIPVVDVAISDTTVETADEANSEDALLEAAAQANAEITAELAAERTNFEEFVASVTNGYRNLVSGIYVPDAWKSVV